MDFITYQKQYVTFMKAMLKTKVVEIYIRDIFLGVILSH